MSTRQMLVDGRSAGSSRISGWERYARGIVSAVVHAPEVAVRISPCNSIAGRITSDLRFAAEVGGYAASHYLSFPPLRPTHSSIVTIHDLTWWKFPETASRGGLLYYKRLAERSIGVAKICTVSHSLAVEIQEYFGSKVGDVSVINPIFRPTSGPNQAVRESDANRPYFVAVGTVEPRKNLDRLAAAYALSGLKTEYDLLLLGRRGWADLPSGVRFVDRPSDLKLKSLIKNAHALVLPSLYEGFGLPILEAQDLGTSVICSELPVFREVSGGNATFFDPLDVSSIAQALLSSARNESQICNAILNTQRYSEDAIIKQIAGVYRSVGVDILLSH